MVESVKIRDRESAEAWLEKQDHQTRVWFGTRGALRVFPAIGDSDIDALSNNSLAALRGLVIASTGVVFPTERDTLKNAGRSAELAASWAASKNKGAAPGVNGALNVNGALYSAGDVALMVVAEGPKKVLSAAVTDVWPIVFHQPRSIHPELAAAASSDADNPGNWGRLWPDTEQPAVLAKSWEVLKTQWKADEADWSFWIEWYEAILDGRPLPWELTQRIALEITNAEWDAGQKVVADRIAKIERDFYTAVTPPLIRSEGGKWDVAPDVRIADEPLEFAIAQVEVALEAALGAGQGNGLSEKSGEAILIRAACARYRHSPSAVATSFWNACMGFQRNIGDIYPEDRTLISLKNVLFTSVEELCEQDPLIRDRIAKLAALETRRMPTADERKNLREVPEQVAEDMTQRALEELSEAVDIVTSSENPPRLYRAKLVNWLNKMGSAIDSAQKNEKRANWLVQLASRIAGWFFKEGE